jgi:aspartate aminotransferase
MLLAERLQKINPSPTLAITAKAKLLKSEGHDVLSLGAGELDIDTPDFIKEAAIDAIHKGHTKYTAVDGIPDLKKAIQKKFQDENDLTYALNEITVNCGAKHSIFNAFYASLNAGDEVIIPTPYWVSYESIVQMMDAVPVLVPCPEVDYFKLTAATLEKAITPKTKWLLLNSPSNPTGAIYTKEELESLAVVLRKHPTVHVLSDDIYEHVIYPPHQFYTLATVAPDLKDRILIVNGVSKCFSMTGWRIGYAAGPAPLIKAMNILQSHSTANPCSISQYAALDGLKAGVGFLKNTLKELESRRNYVVKSLNDISGIQCALPEGAFYVYPSCKGLIGKKTSKGQIIQNDTDFTAYLLEEALVAVVPGIAFGLSPYFRVSYATNMEILEKACARIREACAMLS